MSIIYGWYCIWENDFRDIITISEKMITENINLMAGGLAAPQYHRVLFLLILSSICFVATSKASLYCWEAGLTHVD